MIYLPNGFLVPASGVLFALKGHQQAEEQERKGKEDFKHTETGHHFNRSSLLRSILD